MMSDALLEQYTKKIEPLLPLAKKAFGSRNHVTPEHNASRKYTQLLKEYYEKGGSLVAMSSALGVAYAGVRRRVVTADFPAEVTRKRSSLTPEQTDSAIERIKKAKDKGPEAYHDQLAKEYENGVSLGKVAVALGLSSSQPLYYGVQRSKIRSEE
jgi:hypothetical protein